MKSEKDIQEMILRHKENISAWQKPFGYLVPTEPDADERHRIRSRFAIAIETLEWVLKDA
jgi:hypothetical protein